MFAPVASPNFWEPDAVRKKVTEWLPNWPCVGRAFFRSRPGDHGLAADDVVRPLLAAGLRLALDELELGRDRAARVLGLAARPRRTGPFSTSESSRKAVFLMRSLTRLGSSMPGSCTRMRSAPSRAISGSATPNSSTRLRIVSTAWDTALSSIWRRAGSLRAKVHLPPAGRVVPVGQETLDGVLELRSYRSARDGDREGRVGRQLDRADARILRLVLQRLDRVVPLGLDGVGRVDLQHEVDAAAQIEAELDRALQGVLEGRQPGPVHSFLACA